MERYLESFLGCGIDLGIFVAVKVGVRGGRQDTVEPGLLVVLAWSCECGTRKLLRIETVRWLLRRVGTNWEGSFDSFGPGIC